MANAMTVGKLREALRGLRDETVVLVDVDGEVFSLLPVNDGGALPDGTPYVAIEVDDEPVEVA